jgi:subtilisin family serine protease
MKALIRRGWLLGLALLAAACSPTTQQPLASNPAAAIPSAPDRQILVTFPDERIGQVPSADPVNTYRPRGNYSNSTWSLKLARELADDYGLRPLTQWPINSLGIHCAVYEIPANLSKEEVLRRLGQDRRIEAVQSMQSYRTMAQAYSDPYFKLQTGIQAMGIEAAHQVTTGKNVTVAVIDTGIDGSHPDLAGQVALEKNFVAESKETREDIHGTAVAGVIAATANNRQGIVGVAPGAHLLALKACWPVTPQKPEAMCDSLSLALAMDGAITLKPQIINLSLAGRQDPLVERLVRKALANGIIVVASAGPPAETYFPASVPGVVAVHAAGSTSAPGGIAAPGSEVLTTLPNGSYSFMSGSSFSAAHVSGLVALMLELKPHLSPAQVANLLADAMPKPSGQTYAAVDTCAALAKTEGFPVCGSATAKADSVPRPHL